MASPTQQYRRQCRVVRIYGILNLLNIFEEVPLTILFLSFDFSFAWANMSSSKLFLKFYLNDIFVEWQEPQACLPGVSVLD